MADIKSPKLLWIKAGLFLSVGILAGAAILILHPEWSTAALLALAVWAFSRAYYFAFYVIQHYIDPAYRFAGLSSVVAYLWRRR